MRILTNIPPTTAEGRRRPRRHFRRRRLRSVSMLPTFFTLGNLLAGFAAIHYAAKPVSFEGPWGWTGLTFAGILIFVGMFFDGVDGTVARLTRSSSNLGAQLDSLCDMVTFGVAPAFMALRLVIIHLEQDGWVIGPEADTVFGRILWGVAAAYVACAALRLARYNVESNLEQVNDHLLFRGLPTPGAAGAVVSLVILHQHLLVAKFAGSVPRGFVQGTAMVVPFIMLLCAVAMVSSIPYVHATNRYLRGPRSFTYLARIVIVLALAVWWLQESLAIVFAAYALSGPIRLGWKALHHRNAGHRVPPASTSIERSNTLST